MQVWILSLAATARYALIPDDVRSFPYLVLFDAIPFFSFEKGCNTNLMCSFSWGCQKYLCFQFIPFRMLLTGDILLDWCN